MKDPVVIYSGEHGAFWGPGGSGYYNNHFAAGLFEREDAVRRTSHCGKEKLIEILPPAPNHPELLRQRIDSLEAELASARNLYAAQEERYERGRKAEDTWSAAMASVYLATSGCSLPEFDTPMEVAERIKEHFAALSDEVDHLRADASTEEPTTL